MADVMPDRPRDRAQLLLVGALALAVVFLSLSLLLNSVIYTEHLATRQTDSDTKEATSFRFEVVDGLGGAITHVNRNNSSSFADRRARYRTATDAMSSILANYSATRGVATNVSRHSLQAGTRLVDANYSTGLVRQGGAGDWIVATDSKVRRVRLNVNVSTIESGDEVHLDFDDGTVSRLVIESPGGTPQIRVEGVAGDNTCTLTEGQIAVSAGRVDGRHCEALAAVDLSAQQNVSIDNGGQIEGTFSMVVDRQEAGVRTAVDAANYPTECSPPATLTYNDSGDEDLYTSPAIYATSANITVQTNELDYERSVRAAPGEHGDPASEPTFKEYVVTPTTDGFDVEWNATDPDSSVNVDIRVHNISSGAVTEQLDQSAEGSTTISGLGDQSAYYVNATAADGASARRVTEIHPVDGGAGCPP